MLMYLLRERECQAPNLRFRFWMLTESACTLLITKSLHRPPDLRLPSKATGAAEGPHMAHQARLAHRGARPVADLGSWALQSRNTTGLAAAWSQPERASDRGPGAWRARPGSRANFEGPGLFNCQLVLPG
jgi:hypothetical protein